METPSQIGEPSYSKVYTRGAGGHQPQDIRHIQILNILLKLTDTIILFIFQGVFNNFVSLEKVNFSDFIRKVKGKQVESVSMLSRNDVTKN